RTTPRRGGRAVGRAPEYRRGRAHPDRGRREPLAPQARRRCPGRGRDPAGLPRRDRSAASTMTALMLRRAAMAGVAGIAIAAGGAALWIFDAVTRPVSVGAGSPVDVILEP